MTFQPSFTYWASFDPSSTAKDPLIEKAFFRSHLIEGPVSGIEEKKEELNTNWNSDFNYFALHPEFLQQFDIPWKINFSQNIDFSNKLSKNLSIKKESFSVLKLNSLIFLCFS